MAGHVIVFCIYSHHIKANHIINQSNQYFKQTNKGTRGNTKFDTLDIEFPNVYKLINEIEYDRTY
jgi:hypothetical protein